MAAHPTPHDHSHHIVPVTHYVATFAALTVLMLATVGASYVHFPGGTITNNLIAMAIATVKATLVVLVFMNVRNGTNLVKMWAVLGFVWFGLLFILYCDYEFRQFEVVPTWDARDPGSAMQRTKIEPMAKDPNMVNVRVR